MIVVQWLLRLYPKAFRERYGAELLESLQRDRVRPRYLGRRGAMRFWAFTITDCFRTAFVERCAWSVRRRAARTENNMPVRDSVATDIRQAVRGLIRDPGYAAIAILTLGLGVGATTSVFTVVSDVLLTPLPYAESAQLVRVYERERDNPGARMVAYGNYIDLSTQSAVFEHLAIWAYSSHNLTGAGPAVGLDTREASSNFAQTFRAEPALGRWLTAQEERGGSHVVVLSDRVWRRRFGANPSVLGTAVQLDGEPYDIVGVMAPGFDAPGGAEAWVPLAPVVDPSGLRRWHRHAMIARLRPGLSTLDAQPGIDALALSLERAYPDTNTNNYFELVPMLEDEVGERRAGLLVVFGAVALLLLIGCVNVAALALARSSRRAREQAVRAALGASRGRLARLLIIESLVLGTAGSLLGLSVSIAGVRALLLIGGRSIPRAAEVGAPDLRVFGFAVAISVLTGLAVALIPALRVTADADPTSVLRATRSSASRTSVRYRRVLVAAQLTLAFSLATGAGLLIRSFQQLNAVDSGVDAEQVLTFELRLPSAKYPERAQVARFLDELLASLEQLPGVTRAAATLTPPVDDRGWSNPLTIRGRVVSEQDVPSVGYVVATPGYFDTLGVPLREGRSFRVGEPGDGEPVAVINRAAAERHWPDGDAVGQLILGNDERDDPWVRVIGVVENIRQSLVRPADPQLFVPVGQDRVLSYVVLLRTTLDAGAVLPAAHRIVEAADPDIPVSGDSTLSARIARATAQPRFNAALTTTFAALALLLAAVGVFGVVSYSVAQRRQEFGIRMAVGASTGRVMSHVLRETLLLAAVAITLGLVGARLFGHLLESLLFGVTPTDPTTLAVVSLIVGSVSLAAALFPARVAGGLDPIAILREQ